MTTGRNAPCPCGSGKKHKKCCLSSTYVQKGKEDSIRGMLLVTGSGLVSCIKKHQIPTQFIRNNSIRR